MGSYAEAGVDYSKIDPFKRAMRAVARRTFEFPAKRGVKVFSDGSFQRHSVSIFERWRQVTEGLGNKNWIAEWLYAETKDPVHFAGIGIDTAMMAVVDLLCYGALPVVYTDEVAAGDSDWFADEVRASAMAESYFEACRIAGMALLGGESPSLRYLVRAEPPVKSAPVLSGCALGVTTNDSFDAIGDRIQPGQVILGIPSSGIHANGISLVIKRAMALPEKFFTRLPNGQTLGTESLIPTRSYVAFVEALIQNRGTPAARVVAIVPATGGGVAKVTAASTEPFTYRIRQWVDVPPLFQFMRYDLGVPLQDCLETFNWGIGLFVITEEQQADRVIEVGRKSGYEVHHLGEVEMGDHRVIFEPEGIELPPPGE